jgi:O-methyltransferase
MWRIQGGHALLAAAMFDLNKSPRKIYMYDTFEGMTYPSASDTELKTGIKARDYFNESSDNSWCAASVEEVTNNFLRMNLLSKEIIFIKGDVDITLRNHMNLPNKIAILRLDTDWYSSTKTELETLYPKLVQSGILIIDDYGWWSGSRAATDEFFKNRKPFMSYIDQGARILVKNTL